MADLVNPVEVTTKQFEDEAYHKEIRTLEAKNGKIPKAVTKSALDLLSDYERRIKAKELPQLYKQSKALEDFEVGPELICILGAPPGAGKTSLVMQILFDVLEHNPHTRAVLAVTDTSIDAIFRRQLVRMTGIASKKIRFGNLSDEEMHSVVEAIADLKRRLTRVSVFDQPSIALLDKLANEQPGLLVLDYVQQFAPNEKDLRTGVNAVMARFRLLAQANWGVLAISATKRDQNGKHEAKELGLSSFRESGGIEFDADAAYVLQDNGAVNDNESMRDVCLKCVKNRHDTQQNFDLYFDRERMSFLPKVHPEFMAFSGATEEEDIY